MGELNNVGAKYVPGGKSLYFRDADAYVKSGAAGEITIAAATQTTVGVPGEIGLGDSTERNCFPNTALKMNLGKVANPFGDVYMGGILNLGAPTTATIATGAITFGSTNLLVDTEAAAASDDLDTISGGVNGDVLIIGAANSARSVVVKNATGNLQLAGSDFTMDNAEDVIILLYRSALTAWVEIARANNGS